MTKTKEEWVGEAVERLNTKYKFTTGARETAEVIYDSTVENDFLDEDEKDDVASNVDEEMLAWGGC